MHRCLQTKKKQKESNKYGGKGDSRLPVNTGLFCHEHFQRKKNIKNDSQCQRLELCESSEQTRFFFRYELSQSKIKTPVEYVQRKGQKSGDFRSSRRQYSSVCGCENTQDIQKSRHQDHCFRAEFFTENIDEPRTENTAQQVPGAGKCRRKQRIFL